MAQESLPRPAGSQRLPFALQPRWGGPFDIAAACTLVLAAGVAALLLPDGSVLRMVLAMSVLFFAPGYLLIEAACGPARNRAGQAWRALAAVGISPPIVGVLALATALVPGGFRPAPIIATLTLACFALAAVAQLRRRVLPVADAVQTATVA